MDQTNNRSYYQERAEASRNQARRATSPIITGIHSKLATRYDEVVADLERNDRPKLSAQA